VALLVTSSKRLVDHLRSKIYGLKRVFELVLKIKPYSSTLAKWSI